MGKISRLNQNVTGLLVVFSTFYVIFFVLFHIYQYKNYLFSKAWANIAWFYMGGICGTSFLTLKTGSLLKAAFITLIVVVVKELIDEITSYVKFLAGKYGLDPAGGDWRDILLGILGVLTTLLAY